MLMIICYIAIGAVSSSANILTDLPKCNRSDPKFDACLKSAVETVLQLLSKSDMDFGIPSIEPIVVTRLYVYPVEHFPFEEAYSNIRLYNHSTAEINDLQAAVTDTTFWIKINAYCPKVKFMADYEYNNAVMNGVDYSGKGQMAFTHFGYNITMTMMGRVPKGSKRLTILTSTVDEQTDGFFTTYTTEDPKIAKALSDAANDNWETIYLDVKDQFEAFFAAAYKDIANAIFSKIDFEVLFPKN